jgi:hypothetical protein
MAYVAVLLDEHKQERDNDLAPADLSMKTADRDWVRSEVKAVVKTELKSASADRDPKDNSLVRFIKEWGLGGGMLISFITLLLIGVSFQTHTNDRLDSIEATLRNLQASSDPRKVLSELSTLSPKSLARNLPALLTVSEKPASQIKPPPAELRSVGNSLLHVNQTTPQYWPTLLQFVQFASNYSSKAPPPGGPVKQLKNLQADSFNAFKLQENFTYRLSGEILGIEFRNDRIILTPDVMLTNVRFINCAFEFEGGVDDAPKKIRDTGHMLLASGLEDARVSNIAGM